MTPSDEQNVIAELHAMEVRFTERLTRIEAEASAWRKTHEELRSDIQRVEDNAKDAARAVALAQAADKEAFTKTTLRLTVGLVVVGLAAAGRLGVSIVQMFAG